MTEHLDAYEFGFSDDDKLLLLSHVQWWLSTMESLRFERMVKNGKVAALNEAFELSRGRLTRRVREMRIRLWNK